jgi:hypothetical protein
VAGIRTNGACRRAASVTLQFESGRDAPRALSLQNLVTPSETGYKGYITQKYENLLFIFNDLTQYLQGYIWVTFWLSGNLFGRLPLTI